MKNKMKWLAALKIWVVIYPSITLFYYIFGSHLTGLPLYQRTFLVTVSLVPWMFFIGIPLLERTITWVTAKRKK